MSSVSIKIVVGQDLVRISAIYKSSGSILEISDLEKLTNVYDRLIVVGDINSKYPLHHSRCTNPAGNTLQPYSSIGL